MAVNISATFKKDQKPLNGLATPRMEALLADETRLHETYVIVAVVRPHAIRIEAEDGSQTPTVRLEHIEPLEGEAAATARELLNQAYTLRTGKDPQMQLDFGVGDGEREVPGPSGEELTAELDERRAAREQNGGEQ